MPTKDDEVRLTTGEREFLTLVARAVVVNPFSDERAEIDAKLSGGSPREAYETRTQRVVDVVRRRLQALEAAGKAVPGRYGEPDRGTVAYALLFDIYHQSKDAIDQSILEQIDVGDRPCAASFAAPTLVKLRARGFDNALACRYLALFYQIRRAFYFIDRALVGRSPCMQALKRSLWNSVFTSDIRSYDRYLWNRMEDFSTLFLGETGTGKGTAAAAIGRSGFIPFDERKDRFAESFTRAFVSLNLSQFPESLIESELFGHTKGAFTGAVEGHKGVFSTCSPYGSILLDEIGEVSVPLQIKLLQVLQDRVFSPVGSHEKQRFRGRVIAATNRGLAELRAQGTFRDDFFYRLSSDVIVVPPLRQRLAEDPGELYELLVHTIGRLLGEPSEEMVAMVRKAIDRDLGPGYPWPGNVRELEQCARRVLLKGSYEGVGNDVVGDLSSKVLSGIESGAFNAQELLSRYCALLYQRYGTYEQVAKQTGLDRRTVKKYLRQGEERTS